VRIVACWGTFRNRIFRDDDDGFVVFGGGTCESGFMLYFMAGGLSFSVCRSVSRLI
jgi:hypothetical protein